MKCEHCLTNLAPRSQAQLAVRRRNVEKYQNVDVSLCPKCGGTEWALCEDMIRELRPEPEPSYAIRPSWLRGWLDKMFKGGYS